MIEFFCPILEHFCPLFVQIAQMGLILPRWGLISPRKPPPTPVLYSAVTIAPLGICTNTKHPQPHPKTPPFSGLILKVGKMNYCLGKMDPIWAKCLKSGQNFSRSGQKKIIHQDSKTAGRLYTYGRWFVKEIGCPGGSSGGSNCKFLLLHLFDSDLKDS